MARKCEDCHKEIEGYPYLIPPPPWCFSWEKVCKECYERWEELNKNKNKYGRKKR